ncbi:nucleotidyltransferase domain-containing protein [candidate division KSB1 bacterium]|nr:nucleotidyltransferase domain-containing protein [candidate division KSB1 bacterium]
MNLDPKLQTDEITPELIDYIVEKIVHEIQPEKIILYGSYTRGDYHKDSDLDLLIIKDGEESSRILGRKVDSLFSGRLFALDVRVRKPSEVEWNFRAQNPFCLYHIFKGEKVLFDKQKAVISKGSF